MVAANIGHDLESILVRHKHVGDDDLERLLLQHARREAAVARASDLVASLLEEEFGHFADVCFVIYH